MQAKYYYDYFFRFLCHLSFSYNNGITNHQYQYQYNTVHTGTVVQFVNCVGAWLELEGGWLGGAHVPLPPPGGSCSFWAGFLRVPGETSS